MKPTPHRLSASILSALADARKPVVVEPSADLLAEDARDALEAAEAVMLAITEMVQPVSTERSFLGLQLARVSCDHGRAMLFLLANNPLDMAASALALHRAQIESFLRSAFYSQIANDDELADFFDADQGPRRRTAKGKWSKISVEDLAKEVQATINAIEGADIASTKLASMVANAWDPLCAMVHGGRAVHALYVDGQRQIGCAVPANVHFQMTVNAVAIAIYCLVISTTIAGFGGHDENEALDAPMLRFNRFLEHHNARVRSVGMRDMQRITTA